MNDELIERWADDDTPQGFERYLYSRGMYPPGYDFAIEYDVELYYPPGSDEGVLAWNTSRFGVQGDQADETRMNPRN
ncbi:hypothetical protein [Stackebrandtia albiflava]|uniref:hypothetical protein n=1 Tax=Stackebrandtia albiflava TaxID=406432 RepID=UPI0011BF118D|nr:hypothetical protein [Stackebrandtia albiflava]